MGQRLIHIIQSLLALAVFFVFTGYTFLNARLVDAYGDMVLLVLLFLALPRLAAFDFAPNRRFLLSLFWAFLALALASVLFPPSPHAKLGWFVLALYRLVFAGMVVLALRNLGDLDRPVLRWGLATLCLLLAFAYLGDHLGWGVQEALQAYTPMRLDRSEWHDKNYAFWQLLLMWGAIALHWQRGRAGNLTALVLLLVSTAAIFVGTSESSQLALAVSLVVFLLAHGMGSRRHGWVYAVLILSVVALPVLWVCLAPVKPLLAPVLPQIKAITSRVELFDFTASMIKKELVLGYGFGSTLLMPIPKGQVGWQHCYPGGHTHNLTLQFLMDHGLLGLFFLTGLLACFCCWLRENLADSPQAPAVWALVIAGLVLFSLSYAAWMTDIVLMYGMWLGLVFAVTTRKGWPAGGWLAGPAPVFGAILFGLAAVLCYAVDYLFLAGR